MTCNNQIVDMRVLVHTKLPKLDNDAQESKLTGPWHAFNLIWHALEALQMRQTVSLQNRRLDAFSQALKKCSVGLITKTTRNNLQISTSLGCAALVFKGRFVKTNDVGLVFHFGAGKTNATAFRKLADGTIAQLFDIELCGANAPSPNSVLIGGYAPTVSKCPQRDQADMQCMLQTVCQKLSELDIHVAWTNVFVTGPIRDFIDTQKDPTTTQTALREYFVPITTQWPNALGMSSGRLAAIADFEICRDTEAWFDDEACKAFYKSLLIWGHIDNHYQVVSYSACDVNNDDISCKLSVLGIDVAGKKLKSKDHGANVIINHVQRIPRQDIDLFVDEINSIIACGKTPLIPFASGFTPMFANVEFFGQVTQCFESTRDMFLRRKAAKLQQCNCKDSTRIIQAIDKMTTTLTHCMKDYTTSVCRQAA